jgi:AcrR family transcriptional regulator
LIEMDRRKRNVSKALGPEALIEVAAALMDEHGIDGVSDSQIIQVSGHRNRSAIKYHFGSRDDLVRAVMMPTMEKMNAERNALLDHLETVGGGQVSARSAVEVAVGPLARQLRSPEGRRYLRLGAQVLDHPRFVNDIRDVLWGSTAANRGLVRSAALLGPYMQHIPPAVRLERASLAVGFVIRACADQARLLDNPLPSRPPHGLEDFVANLVDTTLAMLLAPSTVTSVSGEEPSHPRTPTHTA